MVGYMLELGLDKWLSWLLRRISFAKAFGLRPSHVVLYRLLDIAEQAVINQVAVELGRVCIMW